MKRNLKSKSSTMGKTKPNLTDFMIKIQEQLAVLEKKIDGWTHPVTAKFDEVKEQPKLVPPTLAPHRPSEVKQVQGRRERVLYKAVCADCHKDCEIPFKPSGERPVYCKGCFSKRKAGSAGKPHVDRGPRAGLQKGTALPAQQNRQVIVTKKGVGKVTVSEIVRAPSHDISKKGNSPKPARNSKRP